MTHKPESRLSNLGDHHDNLHAAVFESYGCQDLEESWRHTETGVLNVRKTGSLTQADYPDNGSLRYNDLHLLPPTGIEPVFKV